MRRLDKNQYRTVAGRYYGTPKELWGFVSDPGRGGPESIAIQFLKAHAEELGLSADVAELRRRKPRIIFSLAATHVIFQQTHQRLRIHRAYVTVHIGRGDRVYLTKNRAVPAYHLPKKPKTTRSESAAVKRATRAVTKRVSACAQIGKLETLWYPYDDTLRLARKVRLQRKTPREEWIVYVDASTGRIISQYDNLSAARGIGRIFNPNPVIALGDFRKATTAGGKPRKRLPDAAYSRVHLRDLDDSGYLQGKRVTTAPTRGRIKRANGEFIFDSHDKRYRTGFKEVMVYYHIDNAIRYLESLGYRGQRAVFEAPIPVNVKGTRADNSWYSPGTKQLTFGTGGVDDAEDAETILHEFGHALQDAITPDFGQSTQAAAIGEGFGDYFAASFFASKKKREYETSVMTWDAVEFDEEYDPPCLRRVDEEFTFEDFDHDSNASEHDNGMIWSATLWAINRSIGRKRADRIIIESHFQLDGFTTFSRAARAIIDANRNLYNNKYKSRLVRIFRDRGIGPVE